MLYLLILRGSTGNKEAAASLCFSSRGGGPYPIRRTQRPRFTFRQNARSGVLQHRRARLPCDKKTRLLDFQNSLLGSSIPLFLKCSPKRRTWHVLGLFPSLWPCVVEGWSGGGREVVGGGREVVGRWSEVVGGWSEVVGEWSEGGRGVVGGGRSVVGRWSEGGRKLVGGGRLEVEPGSKGVVLLELHVFPYLGHAVQFFT